MMLTVQWTELLRDPLWQFIGVVLAVVALLVAVVTYMLQRQRKILQYRVIAANRLLSVREELEGRLQVRFDEHEVKDLSLLVFDLFNAGDAPIRTVDYESPISFSFGDTARVLSAEAVEVHPQGIAADLAVGGEKVRIAPMLLNPRDSIRVKVLLSDFDGVVTAEGRIVGVSAIKIAPETKPMDRVYLFCGAILFAAGFWISPSAPRPAPVERGLAHWVGIGFMLLGTIALARALFMPPSSKKLLGSLRRPPAKAK